MENKMIFFQYSDIVDTYKSRSDRFNIFHQNEKKEKMNLR